MQFHLQYILIDEKINKILPILGNNLNFKNITHGFFTKNGKLNVAKTINIMCKPDEIIIFLYTHYLSLYGSDIKATLVNPEPDNIPIISKTLP